MSRREVAGLAYPGGEAIRKMRKSDKTNKVAGRLQAELHQRGMFDGDHDKVWSLKLKRAVKEFQRTKGLTVDGIPGEATWKALGWKVPSVGSGNKEYPWIWFRAGVHIPPDKGYMRNLNALGEEGYKKHGRRLVMVSGYRPCGSHSDSTGASTQWGLWKLYQAGRGNLAARPCTSNHGRGYASDCGWEARGGGGYVSYALAGGWTIDLLKKHQLKLPMWPPWSRQIEAWHIEKA